MRRGRLLCRCGAWVRVSRWYGLGGFLVIDAAMDWFLLLDCNALTRVVRCTVRSWFPGVSRLDFFRATHHRIKSEQNPDRAFLSTDVDLGEQATQFLRQVSSTMGFDETRAILLVIVIRSPDLRVLRIRV